LSESHYIAGIHSVRTALKHGVEQITGIWYDQDRHDRRLGQLLSEARKEGVKLNAVDKLTLAKLSEDTNHQGVVAETSVPSPLTEADLTQLLKQLEQPPLLLILDGVQDPHNLGACLRTADAAGVHAVIAPKDRAVGLTPVVCKVACGAAERVPFIQVTNLARTMRSLGEDHDIWITGTAEEADANLYQSNLTGPLALVMGAEEKGMRRLTREQCDSLVSLPMAGTVESLNVSVAAGVALFEAVRQRNLTSR
jgi:23S rRNA (guanosine2251-2'-O)-methyltransferase